MLSITRRKLIHLLPFGAIWVPLTSIAQGFATFNRSKLRVVTKSGKHEFIVEIAVTDRQHSQGLMFRQSLAKNAGMLFDYKVPTSITMWMKNTYIPLDIIFLDENMKIVGFKENNQPHSLKSISIDKPSRYVLEMNGGSVERNRLKIGSKIRFIEKSKMKIKYF